MTTTSAPPQQRTKVSPPAAVVVVVFLVLTLVVVSALVRGPTRVDRLRIANRSDRPVTIAVRAPDARSVLGLGTVDAGEVIEFNEVIDQGDVWVMELSDGPHRVGEIRRTKARLERDGWSVTIPEDATGEPTGGRLP